MSLHLLERVELVAGAGLRLLDAATGLPVLEGLRCELRRASDGARLGRAVASPSGAFHWPALGALWRDVPSPPARPAAEVWVSDALDRFLPLRVPWPPAPEGLTEYVLCSAPGRPAPAGCATLHAWLADASGAAAAWARVVATGTGGRQVPGMSDGDGRFTLHLPFPRPERRPAASPPSPPASPGAGLALAATVSLVFEYGPDVGAEAARHGAPRLDLWLAQPRCAALADVDGSSGSGVRVSAGVPLVLRTQGLPPDRSDLRLVPL